MTSRTRWVIISSAFAAVFVALAASAVFLWGVYRAHWEGPFITTVADAIPIPAARVGSHSISLHEYFSSLRSVNQYLNSEEAAAQGQKRPMNDDDRKSALERLIQEAALAELAASRGVSVTADQEQAVLAELDVTATSTDAFQQYIQTNYGWNMEDFKAHIIRPLVLTRVLGASFAADHNGDVNALSSYITDRIQKPDVVRYVAF